MKHPLASAVPLLVIVVGAALLADAGCRVCQGDLFAYPGLADEIEPILRTRLAA